jgi:hypothetical protein
MRSVSVVLALAMLGGSPVLATQALAPGDAFAAAAKQESKQSREQRLAACRKKVYDAKYRDTTGYRAAVQRCMKGEQI